MTYREHPHVTRLLRVSVTVSDLDRAEAFYRDGLGFKTDAYETGSEALSRLLGTDDAWIQSLSMRLGDQTLELLSFDPPGRTYPRQSTARDLWFQHIAIVTSDMSAAYTHLQRLRPTSISRDGPQQLPDEAGGVIAFKFRDPDGHPLELLQFPPGKGARRWDRDGLFLGFDHSAISIADREKSIAFYRDLLGFSLGGHSVNQGIAQEKLDDLLGVVVDVVALRPREVPTPHVELLAYHPPGRRSPAGRQSNDLSSARLVLEVDDLRAMVALMGVENMTFISPGIVVLDDGSAAALIADPDDHHLLLVSA